MNGIIRDQITGKPLQAVAIFESDLKGQQIGTRGTTSDPDGKFIVDFPATNVTFRIIGYQPLTITNRTGFVIIDLMPISYDLPGGDIVASKPLPWWILLLTAVGIYQAIKK